MIALLLAGQLATTAPYRHVLEADFHVGLSMTVGEQAVQELAISDNRKGETLSLGFVYKTRYFLSPFLDVGYTAASSGGTIVPGFQTGGPAIADQRLSVWNLSSGLAFDTWRLRLEGGLGIGIVVVRTRLAGDESRADRTGPLAFFAVGLDLVRAPRFDLALKARAMLSSQHLDVQILSLGLEIRGDILRF